MNVLKSYKLVAEPKIISREAKLNVLLYSGILNSLNINAYDFIFEEQLFSKEI